MSTIHVSLDMPRRVPAMPAPPVPVPPRAAPRPTQRRAGTRPPRPRRPEDFFGAEGRKLVKDLFSSRADCWQRDRYEPVLFYGGDSEPQWGDSASTRCSGRTLRAAGLGVLFDSLSLDLERGLRLLSMAWTNDNVTTEGGHDVEEWRAALSGVLWRVGQHYREFARRWGQERAREILSLTMRGLWRG